ncbi:28S ribosomal protein S11, mitochondrial [Orchesella cincta]|uniref:28S ribosomal protein S11, mitochondrial n=1 Tax=Orchesella cincta TaxID=48709 RepID=A0A1D2MWX2_ORCCI|nr:28S ribosomal protein S11, mitochondrial [Orchesella cincta]
MNFPTLFRQFRVLTTALPMRQSALEAGRISQQSCCFPVVENRRWKSEDRRVLIQSMPIKDMGTQGEKQLDVDLVNISKENVYPDADTPNMLFDGVRFADLPICHIKASKNNTIMQVTNSLGVLIAYRSCGMDGFKNTRKGTNIAAQTTAVAISGVAKGKGVTTVRVKVQGLGPGRMSAVKGLQMAGIKVASVTDNTPISFTPPRPRKARRL